MSKNVEEEINKLVKTSLRVPFKLWRDVKIFAAKRGLTLTEVTQAALKRYLELKEKEKEG